MAARVRTVGHNWLTLTNWPGLHGLSRQLIDCLRGHWYVWQCKESWLRLGLVFRWSYGHWLTAYNMVQLTCTCTCTCTTCLLLRQQLAISTCSETWENNPAVNSKYLVARQNVALLWHHVKISPHLLHGRPQGHLLISIYKCIFLMFSHLPDKQTPYWWHKAKWLLHAVETLL